jgi:hypothetical protein
MSHSVLSGFSNMYDNFHIQWHIVTKQGSTECE